MSSSQSACVVVVVVVVVVVQQFAQVVPLPSVQHTSLGVTEQVDELVLQSVAFGLLAARPW